MTKLLTIAILSLSLCAQIAAPDVLYLTEPQLRRLTDTQRTIELREAQLEAARQALESAKKEQEKELVRIQLELEAVPVKFEPLAQHEKGWGFKRKPSPKEKP